MYVAYLTVYACLSYYYCKYDRILMFIFNANIIRETLVIIIIYYFDCSRDRERGKDDVIACDLAYEFHDTNMYTITVII